MTPAPETLLATLSVTDAIVFFAGEAKYRSYPVVDRDGKLTGLVSRADAMRWQVEGG